MKHPVPKRVSQVIRPKPAPLKGKRDDAAGYQQHACHADRIGQLTCEKCRPKGHQQRRGAARNRVGLPEISAAIGPHEKQVVADMERRREDCASPARARRHGDDKGQPRADDCDGYAHHRHRPQSVRAGAQQGIPACMEQCGQQNDEAEFSRHSYSPDSPLHRKHRAPAERCRRYDEFAASLGA